MNLEGKISEYSALELALMCICGYLGSGDARREILGDRYSEVQSLVNKIVLSDTIPRSSAAIPWDAVYKAAYASIKEMQPDEQEYDQFCKDLIESIHKEMLEGTNK